MIKLTGLAHLSSQLCCMLRQSSPAATRHASLCRFVPRSGPVPVVFVSHMVPHLVADESKVMIERMMLSPTLAAWTCLYLLILTAAHPQWGFVL